MSKLLSGVTTFLGITQDVQSQEKAKKKTNLKLVNAGIDETHKVSESAAEIALRVEGLLAQLPKSPEYKEEREKIKHQLDALIATLLEAGRQRERIRELVTEQVRPVMDFVTRPDMPTQDRHATEQVFASLQESKVLEASNAGYVSYLTQGSPEEQLQVWALEIARLQRVMITAQQGLSSLEVSLTNLLSSGKSRTSGLFPSAPSTAPETKSLSRSRGSETRQAKVL